MTLCCGAGWFGGFMDPVKAREVFATPDVCLAGSGAVDGIAEVNDNAYTITGTWKYASGANHATHFTANCIIKKGGQTVLSHEDKPLVLPFIIDKKDVSLLPTWKYIGMVATGSHSFHVDHVTVGANRSFRIDPAYAEAAGQLYQYPFLQLAEATLAVNLSGMAVHFTDLCYDIFAEKVESGKLTGQQTEHLKMVLQKTVSQLNTARADLFDVVDQSWAAPQPDNQPALKKVTEASRRLAITSRKAVDRLYPYCGLQAAAPDTEINRVWRDIHTAGQHALLTFAE